VFGAVERGGRIRAEVIPNSRGKTLHAKVQEYVLPASMVYTDDFQAYKQLGRKGYQHRRINHSARIYVDGDVHTQTIEGFFGLFKNGVRGAYSRGLAEVVAGLPQRVRVALQPPPHAGVHVPRPARPGR
jgi:transposase